MQLCITMSYILEEFVKDLIRVDIIANYQANRNKVREFYNEKYRHLAKCSFYDFNWKLWQYWYINTFTRTIIFFDRRWIDYFALHLGGNRVTGNPFSEKTCVTKNKCFLCCVSFADQASYERHIQETHHNLRLQFVKNKASFNDNKDISVEIKVSNEKSPRAQLKLKFPVKTHLNAVLSIKNTSTKEINIMEVIKMNLRLSEITLQEEFEKGALLRPSGIASVDVHLYFEYSVTFSYPIVVVTELKGSNNKVFHLKEIGIEVTSECSSLRSDSKFITKAPDAYSAFFDMTDAIIPGQRPDPYPSFYKETLPLKQFKIPNYLEITLKELVSQFPQFVARGLPVALHYKEFCSFLGIDRGINQKNYYSNLEKLLHIEENQMRVDIRDYDTESTLQVIQGTSLYNLEVPGLAEARPSLLVGDKVYLKDSKGVPVKYEGIVHRVLETSVHLGFNHRFNELFIPNKKFHVEFGFNRRTIRVEKQALLLAYNHGIISTLYPSKVEVAILSPYDKDLTFSNRQLNEQQRIAVTNIVRPKPYPFIIFGPPGTGKTVTVVESVYQLWKNFPNSRILVCGPSNAAANEVAVRLVDIIQKSDLFRLLGSVYANDNDRKGEIQGIANIQMDGTFYMPSMDDLLKYKILITTVVTAARLVNGGAPSGHFTHVFIDESGFATETQTLIPIAGILSNAENKDKLTGQIILAGDPKQLGPRIHSYFAKYCGYGTSLLERLLKTCELYSKSSDNDRVTKLLKNYRSHETILRVPNELFYDNELVAAGNDYTDVFIGWENLKNKQFPIIFHNVEGEDSRDKTSPSFFNVQEIEQVVEYLSTLLTTKASGIKIRQDHIGVITPYRKQAEKLRTACYKKKWNSLLIGSVEQFQGKERLIIIVSTVRSKNVYKFEEIDQKCQLGFLDNPKRFNVALTRAKALLIVIGNANVLKTDKNWSTFIQYCAENKSVAGKHFDLDGNEE